MSHKFKFIQYLLLATIIIAFFGCPAVALSEGQLLLPARTANDDFIWSPLFQGIEGIRIECYEDDPFAMVALRIDLQDPDIRFFVTPHNGDDKDGETDSRMTSTFLKEFDLQVAINASPFGPVVGNEGEAQDVIGISVSEGHAYSSPHSGFAALYIDTENRAWCAPQSELPEEPVEIHNAVGGFHMLLVEGENIGDPGERHPRTAAGVSEDGSVLYLMVIDGRQASFSAGASLAETAEWMRRLGAYSAVNLDGGGSTTMTISRPEGRALLLNRPIHGGIPGRERPSANHLGVYAAALSPVSDKLELLEQNKSYRDNIEPVEVLQP